MVELERNGPTAGRVPGDALTAAMLREAEAWTSAQGELLSATEAMWSEWIRRRREALDASSRSLQQMCGCRSLADLARVQQEWLTDAVRRTVSDIGALASDAADLTGRIAGRVGIADTPRQSPPAARRRDADAGASLRPEAAE
jgi:phasin protein